MKNKSKQTQRRTSMDFIRTKNPERADLHIGETVYKSFTEEMTDKNPEPQTKTIAGTYHGETWHPALGACSLIKFDLEQRERLLPGSIPAGLYCRHDEYTKRQ